MMRDQDSRRRFLAIASLALPTVLAGCINTADPGDGSGGTDGDSGIDGPEGTGDDRDTVPVLTGHEVSDRAEAPDTERHSDMDAWGLFVASQDAAEEYYGDVEDEHVGTFVEETNFASGDRLVFLRAYAPQTCYRLVLDGDPVVAENGIPEVTALVERTADEDQACGDAMTPVELLVRLSFDPSGGPTDVLEAEIAGHREQPNEFTLEAER